MVNYRRNKIPGNLYFFTVALRDRKSNLLIEQIDDLRGAMKYVQTNYPFKTQAIVVWQLPPEDDNYSTRWQHIKGIFTRRIVHKGYHLKKDKAWRI